MTLTKLGSLRARVVDAGPAQEAPLTVVLLHGFGAPGDDLVALAHEMRSPPGTRFVFPEAPLALAGDLAGGRAWWPIDMARLEVALLTGQAREFLEEEPEGLTAARTAVIAMLEALRRTTSSPIVLGGFSQGAMLSIDVTLRTDFDLAGLVVLSGTLICASEWRSRFARRAGLRVFQSHGSDDPLLPFPIAEVLGQMMREAGMQVEWHPFRGGHGIAPEVLDALSGFLASQRA